jgi:hypothetical protein
MSAAHAAQGEDANEAGVAISMGTPQGSLTPASVGLRAVPGHVVRLSPNRQNPSAETRSKTLSGLIF